MASSNSMFPDRMQSAWNRIASAQIIARPVPDFHLSLSQLPGYSAEKVKLLQSRRIARRKLLGIQRHRLLDKHRSALQMDLHRQTPITKR